MSDITNEDPFVMHKYLPENADEFHRTGDLGQRVLLLAFAERKTAPLLCIARSICIFCCAGLHSFPGQSGINSCFPNLLVMVNLHIAAHSLVLSQASSRAWEAPKQH